MGGLKAVCLISGGKDSLFSILHCLENGHQVVALANLYPSSTRASGMSDDIDSYMYQTVGHAIIPLYEHALGLPLYRQEISGSAVNQSKCYGPARNLTDQSDTDETEDLVPLLRRVKAAHPDVNAVSTGAILSDYQRTRVESVAVRLGLIPLSFLWQWPFLPPHSQSSLLEDMSAVGQDSRIIKVASGGMDDSFLWGNVAEPRTIRRLEKAAQRFGSGDDGAALGEGGEYETLAIAGPRPLWKKRLEVDESCRKVVIGEAGSASILVTSAQAVDCGEDQQDISQLKRPPILEPAFEDALRQLGKDDKQSLEQSMEQSMAKGSEDDTYESQCNHLLVANLLGDGKDAAAQMESILFQLTVRLDRESLSSHDVAYTSIILRDMQDFASVNAVYSAYFDFPNPPARLTIACADVLADDKHLTLSVTCASKSSNKLRKGLHVQSRSYWAPANIGPYSQAIAVPWKDSDPESITYVAGQIPLVPAPMDLPGPFTDETDEFTYQAVLAHQHFIRVGRIMQVRRWVGGIAFLAATSADDARSKATIARQAWVALHASNGDQAGTSDEESEDFDVWHLRNGVGSMAHSRYREAKASASATVQEPKAVPPLCIVRVDALPRGAKIEWATYGASGEGNTAMQSIPHVRHLAKLFVDNILDV